MGRLLSPETLFALPVSSLVALGGCSGSDPRPAPAASSPGAERTTITSMASFIGETPDMAARIVSPFTRETGIDVKLTGWHESATLTLAEYLARLNNRSSSPDVCHLDVTWAGIMAEHMIDLAPHLGEEARMHFPALVKNNTVEGKLVGMPFFTDAGLLYYRTDLLREYGFRGPPETWGALEKMAAAIQAGERARGNKQFWGFVWQGAAYEGLTCNAFEWQVSHGGGHIIEPDRRITVNNPRTIKALEKAAAWVGTISPPGVVAYREEDARNLWQTGNAAFMRNWPYAYSQGQAAGSAIKDKFDVGLLPSGGARHAATLGGWQFGVSRYSNHPREAIAFVRYMTSRRVQAQRALNSFPPTIPDLYDDPGILEATPYYARLPDVLRRAAVARPSTVTGKLYATVSEAYFGAVHSVLTGEARADDAMVGLEAQLAKITGFKTAAP